MDPNPYQPPQVAAGRQNATPSGIDATPLRVCCECGAWLPVKTSDADTKVMCPCGRPILVPLLEEFRNRPDLLSAATIERRIRLLIAKCELPPTGSCAKCGVVVAVDVVPIKVQCERYTARARGGEGFVYIPFLPLLWWKEEERVEIRGRDNYVLAPVCLCFSCQQYIRGSPGSRYYWIAASVVTLGVAVGFFTWVAGIGVVVAGLIGIALWKHIAYGARQRSLKGALCQVPVYRQLLASYPDAVVVMPETVAYQGGGNCPTAAV